MKDLPDLRTDVELLVRLRALEREAERHCGQKPIDGGPLR